MADRLRLRLVSSSRLRKGLLRTASSSDGIVDVAAAAIQGYVPDSGIVALIPQKTRLQARRLLKSNVLKPIKVRQSFYSNKSLNEMLEKALSEVIGPMYWTQREKEGIRLARALDRMSIASWIKAEIETPCSALNKQLIKNRLDNICELKRSLQWWMRVL